MLDKADYSVFRTPVGLLESDAHYPRMVAMRALVRCCYWSGYTLAVFAAALALSWQLLAAQQFLYPFWYRVLGIPQTIARFAPRNPYRPEFQRTNRAERERLFDAIQSAVRHNGRGLAELRYHAPDGRSLGRFLTDPEIVHLHDVSHLLARIRPWAIGSIVTALVWTLLVLYRRQRVPPVRRLLGAVSVVLVSGVAAIVVAGPVRVFYTWHEWVFPSNHPWFFYYQDSLMTTLMQAPNLFIAIGAVWLLSAWLLLAVLLLALHRCSRARSA